MWLYDKQTGTKHALFQHHLMATDRPPEPVLVVDGDILETHKENIVPTREGRSATAISQLYSVPRAQRIKDLAASHAHYRQLIAAAETEDDIDGDPLDAYTQYIKWTMDNYPSGSSSESGLLALLEEATRKFSKDAGYKNDRRYVKVWMDYANLVEQSERVYAYMFANDIGSIFVLPYEEYALVLERNGKSVSPQTCTTCSNDSEV